MGVCTFAMAAVLVLGLAGADRLRPESPKDKHKSPAQAAADVMQRAASLEDSGKIDEAIAAYEEVIRKYPRTRYRDEVNGGIYSDDARDRLMVLSCKKVKGADFVRDTGEGIAKLIGDAIQQGRQEALKEYASCNFQVGKPETDAVWQAQAEQVVPIIYNQARSLEWASASFDLSGSLLVKSRTGEDHVFAFKEASGNWTWVGYYTTDSILLDRLWELKKKRQTK